ASVPFEGAQMDVLMRHLQEMAEEPRKRRSDVAIPDALAALAMRALAKAPEDRFANALEFREALEDCVSRVSTPTGTRGLACDRPAVSAGTFCGSCGARLIARGAHGTMPEGLAPAGAAPRRASAERPALARPLPFVGRAAELAQLTSLARDGGAWSA